MFEAVHTCKWLPLVQEYTFPQQLEALSAAEEAALLAATLHARAPGRNPAPSAEAAAAVTCVAARLDAIIESFGGAVFVKLGDFAPKDVAPPAALEAAWRARLEASSTPPHRRSSNAALAAFVFARSRTLRVTSGAAAVALRSRNSR